MWHVQAQYHTYKTEKCGELLGKLVVGSRRGRGKADAYSLLFGEVTGCAKHHDDGVIFQFNGST